MNYIRNEKMHIFYSILLGIIGGLVGVSIFGLSGYMISLSFFEPPFFIIILIIAVIKMFGLTKGSTRYLERLLSHDATFKMIGRLRAAYFKRSVHSAENTHSVRYIQKLTRYFEEIEDYYIRIIYPYVVAVFIALILTMLSVIIDPMLLVIMLIATLLLLVAMPLIISGISKQLYAERNSSEDHFFTRIYHYIQDFTNVFVVKEQDNVKENLKQTYAEITKNENKEALVDGITELVSLFIQLAVLIIIIVMFHQEQSMLMPLIILLLISFFDLVIPVIKPSSRYFAVKEQIKEVDQALNTAEIKEHNLTLSNMTFRYPETKRDVLTNINIKINSQEKHALIGSSGSGKTTLLNQLIAQADASIMPQHLDFYNATVTENVTMFNHFQSTPEQIDQLLEQFELTHFDQDDFITSNEYLSLGEKKRMHLMRMFLEDKHTWILDEPTASLNTRLRDKVWDEILTKETIIVATHDLSHLHEFDYVHYLEGGTIVESGDPATVLRKNGPTEEAYKRFNDAV